MQHMDDRYDSTYQWYLNASMQAKIVNMTATVLRSPERVTNITLWWTGQIMDKQHTISEISWHVVITVQMYERRLTDNRMSEDSRYNTDHTNSTASYVTINGKLNKFTSQNLIDTSMLQHRRVLRLLTNEIEYPQKRTINLTKIHCKISTKYWETTITWCIK